MKTKILFINPMSGLEGFLLIGISSLIAVLKNAGFEVGLFDTTYYKIGSFNDRKKWERVGEFVPVDMTKYGVEKKYGDYKGDLKKKIEEFKPTLIAVSITTAYNYPLGIELINNIREYYKGLIIAGGKAITVDPEKIMLDTSTNIICIGEGEEAFLELCQSLEKDIDIENPDNSIKNLIIHTKDGLFIYTGTRKLQSLDNLPYPNWDYFDKRHFYRPLAGKVYRYGHIELTRGCIYKCSYCINHKLQDMYRGLGKYFRKKSIKRSIAEIKYLKKRYNLEIIKFWDEDFLLRSEKELKKFAKEFKKINIPFLTDIRLDNITERKVQLLKEMNCLNVSCGIETGNDYIRKKILNRKMKNKDIIKGIKLLNKYGIRTSSLNMIGIPFETRRNVFETIELNKMAGVKNSCVNILQCWSGTKIKKLAIAEGFLNPREKGVDYTKSYLDMPKPYLSKEDIMALDKTFNLYRKVPKVLYPLVKLCEKDSWWRDKLFIYLHKIFK